jgi:hypothetical protein
LQRWHGGRLRAATSAQAKGLTREARPAVDEKHPKRITQSRGK